MSETRIIHGDCMEIIKKIPDNSIDLIVNDPPYGLRKHEWDKIDNYLDWSIGWIKEAEGVLKDTGNFYLFHVDMLMISKLMGKIEEDSDFVFKNLLIWNKRFNDGKNQQLLDGRVDLDTQRNYYKNVEYILFYTLQDETGLSRIYDNKNCFRSIKDYLLMEREASKLSISEINKLLGMVSANQHFFSDSHFRFPIEAKYKQLQSTGFFQRPYESLRQEYELLRQEYESLRYTFNNQKTHHSVWNYSYVKNPDHPTQKPVELIENIIKHSSNEGDVVLDMFAGSGTTGVAAKRLCRHFIGIEQDKNFCQIAKERIAHG